MRQNTNLWLLHQEFSADIQLSLYWTQKGIYLTVSPQYKMDGNFSHVSGHFCGDLQPFLLFHSVQNILTDPGFFH